MSVLLSTTPSALLAQQLLAMLNRLCEQTDDAALIEATLQQVLEALEAGQVSLNMQTALALSKADTVDERQQKLIKAGVASEPDGFAPLIIDNGYLYLARYYFYHSSLQKRLANT